MDLRSALDLFLSLPYARSTREVYRKLLTRFVIEIGPGRPLELIRPEDVNDYINRLGDRTVKYSEHPTRAVSREPLSPATVHNHSKTIRRFFNWCIAQGYLDLSPARFLATSYHRVPLGDGKAATDAEVRAVLQVARRKPRDWAIMLLLIESGARAGEIAGLKIRDLHLSEQYAMVDGKGAKRREIYFAHDAADALRRWLAVRPEVDHDYVFTSTHGGGKLNPQSISQLTRRLCERAGLERRLGAHAFRHYVGVKLARERVPLPVIQTWLGHSDPNTTMQYLRSLDRDDIRATGRLLAVTPNDEDIIARFRQGRRKNIG